MASTPRDAKNPSKLILHSVIDAIDEFEERLEKSQTVLKARVTPGVEVSEVLPDWISQPGGYEEACMALLYAALTEPDDGASTAAFHNLSHISRDGFRYVCMLLTQLWIDKTTVRIQPRPRRQSVVVLDLLLKANVHVASVEPFIVALLRNIASGVLHPTNLAFTEHILDVMIANRSWLIRNPSVVPHIVCTYLRVAQDHSQPAFDPIRQKEIILCIGLLRERFDDCLPMGRDLARLLISIARVQEVSDFWKDIMANPSCFSSQMKSLHHWLSGRTGKRFIIGRVTPDAERHMHFLLSQVKFASRKRYFDWFSKYHLSQPGADSARIDLVRYVCVVVHPSNEILASDITPRWCVIAWLLAGCADPTAVQLMKLALFYDWFFFDADTSIMNIEPAMLLMHNHAQPRQAGNGTALARSMLDFLVRTMKEFAGPNNAEIQDKMQASVVAAFKQCLEKRVVDSLGPIFECTRSCRKLNARLLETFPTLFGQFASSTPTDPRLAAVSEVKLEGKSELSPHLPSEAELILSDIASSSATSGVVDEPIIGREFPRSDSLNSTEAQFSDDDIQEVTPSTQVRMKAKKRSRSPPDEQVVLPSLLLRLFAELTLAHDVTAQSDVVQKILLAVMQNNLDDAPLADVGRRLGEALAVSLETPLLLPPDIRDAKAMSDSLRARPVYVVFRNIVAASSEEEDGDDDDLRTLMYLLTEMYDVQPLVGYHLLYFLKANGSKLKLYKELITRSADDATNALVQDMKYCQDADFRLLGYLIQPVYTELGRLALDSAELMRVVVGTIDGIQLQDLMFDIASKKLRMFRKESFERTILPASLEWDTIEQCFLWNLMAADDLPIEWVTPCISKMEHPKHAEALLGVIATMRRISATSSIPLIRAILSRPIDARHSHSDKFTATAIKVICDNEADEKSDRLTEILSSMLSKSLQEHTSFGPTSGISPSQRRPKVVALDRILEHLDLVRRHAVNGAMELFQRRDLQAALKDVHKQANSSLRSKFDDLLQAVQAIGASRLTSSKPQKTSTSQLHAADKANSGSKSSKRRQQPVRAAASAVATLEVSDSDSDDVLEISDGSGEEQDSQDDQESFPRRSSPRKRRKVVDSDEIIVCFRRSSGDEVNIMSYSTHDYAYSPGLDGATARAPKMKISMAGNEPSVVPPFYLLQPDLPSTSSGTFPLNGSTDLLAYYGLESAFQRFCGTSKRIKKELSSFITDIPGRVDYPPCSQTDENSLRALVNSPPIPKSLEPLSTSDLVGFQLQPGPIPENFRILHADDGVSERRKHKKKKERKIIKDEVLAGLAKVPDPPTAFAAAPATPAESSRSSKKHKLEDPCSSSEAKIPKKKKKKEKKKKKANSPSKD